MWYGTSDSLQVGLTALGPPCHNMSILTQKFTYFGPLHRPVFWPKNSHFSMKIAISGSLDRCLEWTKMVLRHALPCIGVWYDPLDTFQVGRSSLEQPSHLGVVLAIKIAIFWTHPTPDEYLTMVQMVQHHHSVCVTGLWVRSVLVSRINVVLTTKKVTRKAKKWGK